MITRMTVQNFKALRHVQVDLSRFTVLIGQNDTGKTSFLEAVYAVAESTRSQLDHCFWSPWQGRQLVHRQAPDTPVEFSVDLAGSLEPNNGRIPQETPVYSLKLTFYRDHNCKVQEESIGLVGAETPQELTAMKDHAQSSIYAVKQGRSTNQANFEPLLRVAAECLAPAALARWDVEELAMPSRLPANRKYPFDPSGYGLATCIAEMKLGRGNHFQALRDDFCKQFPAFEDIIIRPANVASVERNEHFQKQQGSRGDGYALALLRKDRVEIPAALASGGTLVTLAFLTLLNLEEPRKLLLIEEPENGLHPGRLKEIVALLRRAVAAHPDSQVILTTHSPLLLDYVDPAEVRLFLRNEQDDVEVYNIGQVPDIRDRLKYLMLGELVYNEGEQELVKEIQQHASSHSERRAD